MDVAVYTLARKFPRLIGKFANGQTIPYGPFTYHQIGVFIGGILVTFIALQSGAPKLATAVIAVFVVVPGMVAARRIGFSLARIDSRVLWLARSRFRLSSISTGGRPTTTTMPGPISTGRHRTSFEDD